MPMLDAYIPEGTLDAASEQALMSRLTDILLHWEGADTENAAARAIAWVFLHRPAKIYVGGEPASEPRYRIVASVPEGQLDAERRQGMVAAVTEAVLDAEEAAGRERNPDNVWVFPSQIPEGTWGGRGRIFGLADIAGMVLGDAEAGKELARQRLAKVKAEREAIFQ